MNLMKKEEDEGLTCVYCKHFFLHYGQSDFGECEILDTDVWDDSYSEWTCSDFEL